MPLDFDISSLSNIPTENILTQVGLWLSLIVWFLIIFGVIIFLTKFMRFRVPAEIFEMRGDSIIRAKRTKLKEIIKDGITKYEVRTFAGMFQKKRREYYLNPDPSYKLPTSRGYSFYLLKMGFNAYNPIKLTKYLDTITKIRGKLDEATGKEKAEILKEHNQIVKNLQHDRDFKKSVYTYVPIKFETAVEFEIIPQNLLPHLARSIIETNMVYDQKKWFEPYLLPFSIFLFVILQIIVMGWMFDKVGDISLACEMAENKITSATQQIIK